MVRDCFAMNRSLPRTMVDSGQSFRKLTEQLISKQSLREVKQHV